MNVEKLMKMAGAVRTGGKGSMRRCKNKAINFSMLIILGIEGLSLHWFTFPLTRDSNFVAHLLVGILIENTW